MAEEKPTKNPTVSTFKKEADGSLVLTVTIPAKDIAKAREEVVESAVKNTTLPGFRQGKAPRQMVEKSLDDEKVREEILKQVLPQAYIGAVKEHNLNPIINPKIHVDSIEEGKDWVFTATTCEIPEVKLNKYKEAISKITVKSKIAIPGQEQQQPNFDDIMKALMENVTVTIPGVLVEGEVDRLLSQLLNEIKSLGLSLDQYLASTGKSVDVLRAEYQTRAENDIKVEFALQKVAEEEKISVSQEEMDEALAKAKDDVERQQLQANMYLLANILRQQKTLDFLKNL
jgi:FKBP-type peptidyl-prolyl cis-trans isomerase (trigger factor)